MAAEQAFARHDERLRVRPVGVGQCRLELLGPAHLQGVQLYTQGAGRLLRRLPLQGDAGVRRIPEDGDPRDFRHELFEQLQPFPGEPDGPAVEPRDIPLRAGEAGDEPRADRVPTDRHDDRDGGRRLLGRVDRRRRICDDDIRREADQLRGEVRQTALVILRRAVRNRQVLTLEIPEVAQPLPEALEILDRSGIMRGAGAEKADAADLRRGRSGRGAPRGGPR